MTPALLDEMLEGRLSAIAQALARIAGPGPEPGDAEAGARPLDVDASPLDVDAFLRDIGASLRDVRDLVGRNPGLDAAADDLYRSVLSFAGAGRDGVGARQRRLLSQAHARFRDRLSASRRAH
ncbi:hypothetical protein OPKNFCMD_4745 [Methylobacterium crusticola]|uniref:GGDEF domain-containing protein n=1 Tax=Methylobacterium crusticola TaxID=1697972 RepID=A0ABQ4R4W6_9HYPH|nr:hypothetical protein [Methylobacterium crusticola]GJD51985.1 hypothetical protein OPKNFCMD_4745 [Methylobacterium crusticola]